jgi:hypothetical protein
VKYGRVGALGFCIRMLYIRKKPISPTFPLTVVSKTLRWTKPKRTHIDIPLRRRRSILALLIDQVSPVIHKLYRAH